MANYHEQSLHNDTLKLRRLIQKLPPFTFEFFRGIEHTTSSKTRIAYAYDLNVFFTFITTQLQEFKDISIQAFPVKRLEDVTPDHIEYYLDYLSYYNDTSSSTNDSSYRKEAIKSGLNYAN